MHLRSETAPSASPRAATVVVQQPTRLRVPGCDCEYALSAGVAGALFHAGHHAAGIAAAAVGKAGDGACARASERRAAGVAGAADDGNGGVERRAARTVERRRPPKRFCQTVWGWRASSECPRLGRRGREGGAAGARSSPRRRLWCGENCDAQAPLLLHRRLPLLQKQRAQRAWVRQASMGEVVVAMVAGRGLRRLQRVGRSRVGRRSRRMGSGNQVIAEGEVR